MPTDNIKTLKCFRCPLAFKFLLFYVWSLLYLCSAFWKCCLLFLDCLFVSILPASPALLHNFPSSSPLCIFIFPPAFSSRCRSFCPANLSSIIVGPLICVPFCFSSPSLFIHSFFCFQISHYSPLSLSPHLHISQLLIQNIYLPALPYKYVYLSQLPFHLFPLSSPCVAGYSWWE